MPAIKDTAVTRSTRRRRRSSLDKQNGGDDDSDDASQDSVAALHMPFSNDEGYPDDNEDETSYIRNTNEI